MGWIAERLAELVFEDAYHALKRKAMSKERLQRIEAAVVAWSERLPAGFEVQPDVLLPRWKQAESVPASFEAIRAEMSAERLPEPAAWERWLLDMWQIVVTRNAADGDPGQPLFRHTQEEVRPYLKALSEAIDAALRSDPTLAASTALEMLRRTHDTDKLWVSYRRWLLPRLERCRLSGCRPSPYRLIRRFHSTYRSLSAMSTHSMGGTSTFGRPAVCSSPEIQDRGRAGSRG